MNSSDNKSIIRLSLVVRNLLKEILSADKDIVVVGAAPDPFIARDKILKYEPDVVILDVEMPRMDGITFLKKLMRYHPVPVIILSSLTQKGAVTTIEAMEEGAVEVMAKPNIDVTQAIEAVSTEIIEKIKLAASARVKKKSLLKKAAAQERPAIGSLKQSTHKTIAMARPTEALWRAARCAHETTCRQRPLYSLYSTCRPTSQRPSRKGSTRFAAWRCARLWTATQPYPESCSSPRDRPG